MMLVSLKDVKSSARLIPEVTGSSNRVLGLGRENRRRFRWKQEVNDSRSLSEGMNTVL